MLSPVRAQFDASSHDDQKPVSPDQVRLPNGKLQQEEIVKSEHDKVVQEVNQLVALSQALQKDVQDSGAHVLSVSSIHKTEDIERLAKRIRSRMRGY